MDFTMKSLEDCTWEIFEEDMQERIKTLEALIDSDTHMDQVFAQLCLLFYNRAYAAGIELRTQQLASRLTDDEPLAEAS